MNTRLRVRPKPRSVWSSTRMPRCDALNANTEADVCIIGAGIAGLSAAYCLTREGKSVVVLDDGALAGGMTCATTAHLSNEIDDRYIEIERIHGTKGARLAAQSHSAAIDAIAANVEREQIDCDFERVDGYLFLSPGESEDLLEREMAAAHRAGLTSVQKLKRAPVDAFDSGACLHFPEQAQFHPLRYLAGLTKAIQRQGGRLYTRSHADEVDSSSPSEVKVGSLRVRAEAIIVATNTPINDRVAIHTKQSAYMTYVIGVPVPRGSLPHLLLWDTEDPYHYVRLQSGRTVKRSANALDADILIVGGEDHRTGQADDTRERHGRLESWTRERFPMAGPTEFKWSGQVMESIDGLAFIGRNPLDSGNVYVATGDSGMGMTHGTIAGILLTDLIVGRENPWSTLYDPSRVPLRAMGEYAKDAAITVAQYTDWLTPGDVSSVEEIARDNGAVLRRGLSKVAVYRDNEGQVHEMSAVCTHLGCIVRWNANEKTWDCPCHGSRFEKLGKPINGPANKPLTPAGKDEE